MSTRLLRFPLVLALVAMGACGGKATPAATTSQDAQASDSATPADGAGDAMTDVASVPLAEKPDCNPMGWGTSCLSGWPTSFYLSDDASTKTGRRVSLTKSSLPSNSSGVVVDPTDLNRRDGMSPNAPILLLPPEPLDPASLHGEASPTDAADAALVLIDAATGQRLKHLEELDNNSPDAKNKALFGRLWVPAREQMHIIVAVTDHLKTVSGQPLPRPAALQALIDGKATGYPRIDSHLIDWQKDLAMLTQAGVDLTHVRTAWHYDTASSDWTYGVALQGRDLLAKAVGAAGLGYKIKQVEVDPKYVTQFLGLPAPSADSRVVIKPMHGDIALRIRAQVETPLLLDGEGTEALLNWTGPGNTIALHGTTWRDFIVLVPPSVIAKGGHAPMVLYGHGLLRGSCVEGCVEKGGAEFMPHLAAGLGAVVYGMDWWGLSQADLALAMGAVTDFSHAARLTDKLVQAAVQVTALSRTVQHKLMNDQWFQLSVDAKSSAPVGDPNGPVLYYGNSLGGILGTTATSMHPDVSRMAMNVAGGPWSLLMTRSSDFAAFLTIFQGNYPDGFAQTALVVLMQSLFDLSDPVNFVGHSIADPFPGVQPDRHAMWPVSWGDAQVPNIASGMLQRTAKLPLMQPPIASWGGTSDGALPELKSAWIQWDSKRGTYTPGALLCTPDNGAHLATRWMPEYQQMIGRFLLGDGAIEPRYCLLSGRDTDGQLPCDLAENIPTAETDEKPIITWPLPTVP